MRNFYRENARWLSASALMNFASGFGQTFFIALFAGSIRGEFGLSHGEWGTVYAIGTFSSAVLMLLLGGLADRVPARRITIGIMVFFALFCLSMAIMPAVIWLLPVVIFGLRFCGQGMLSHLSIVFVGRWFRRNRGKSIAVATLGFSITEAIFPIIFVHIMLISSWRVSWGAAAGSLLIMAAVMYVLLGRERQATEGQAVQGQDKGLSSDVGMNGVHWTRGMMLRHWVFWLALPATLAQPVLSTTMFFQLVHLNEIKGWNLDDFVALIPLYTAFSLAAMFVAGALIDRYGVSRLMSVYLLPMCVALLVFAFGDSLFHAAIALVFQGLMQGVGGAVAGAFWPEYYGTKHLGSIRAVASSTMVFATALGPLASGWLIDMGFGLESQFLVMAGWCIVACMLYGLIIVGSRHKRATIRG